MNLLAKFLFSVCLCSGISFANTPKTLIITCATGEIGTATAKLLAADHNLLLTGRNLAKLQQLQQECQAQHPHLYEICPLDYSNSDLIAQFKMRLDQLNTPISGVLLIPPRPSFYGKNLFQEEAVWLEVFQTTFTGPLETLKATLPHLAKGGKIVVIAGNSSIQYLPESGPTCVIRRMWTAYTKALSHQLGPQGICVNTLSPGVILTSFHQERIEKIAAEKGISYDEQLTKEVANIPLRRHAVTEEVAETIRFFLSDQANFINGTNLVIDGGYTTTY